MGARGSASHLLVETEGWCDGGEDGFARSAMALAGSGRPVVLLLAQQAVSGLAAAPLLLGRVLDAGVTVLADEFSLRQHAIATCAVPAAVGTVDAEEIAALLLDEQVAVVWH